MIELSPNINPTTEQLKTIELQFRRTIEPFLRIQCEYLKIHMPTYTLDVASGKITMNPIKDETYLKCEKEIQNIKDYYTKKYSPYFNFCG